MKVALFAESFLPHMNGVTHSLLQVLAHLERRGHEALVIAPKAGPVTHGLHGASVVYLRSVPLPNYPQVRVTTVTTARLIEILAEFAPDVIHLASPFVLGWQALTAAEALGVPSVAVYQTDVPGYAERYGIPAAAAGLAHHVGRLHRRATLTLSPSTSADARLAGLGVPDVRRWGRGVDAARFRPERRSEALRARFAPDGEVVVGYVGRLAPEKQVEDLAVLCGIPGVRVVIVGDGPERATLEVALPGATFTGFLGGNALAEAMASFDVFVHPGEHETFCQTIQEAFASGVPVVATGAGGPLDLVESSRTGWLYRPGDLDELRLRVLDLVGDTAKRRAFAVAALGAVADRSWERLGDQLLGHYRDAIELRQVMDASVDSVAGRALCAPTAGWQRIVAIGDSISEGLWDPARAPGDGVRGWADRLAFMLTTRRRDATVHYANLAIRSARIRDVLGSQVPRAVELGAELALVHIGSNDLVKRRARPAELADQLAVGVARLRAAGCDVLVIAPFLPMTPIHPSLGFALRILQRRFTAFERRLGGYLSRLGATMVRVSDLPTVVGDDRWAEDRVHLNPAGHRALAYAAAAGLGVRDADALAALDEELHRDVTAPLGNGRWLRTHVGPWLVRRLRRRTAGDGRTAKHSEFVVLQGKSRMSDGATAAAAAPRN
ncbi:MAG TPA: glycosyltransferase [Candidatus Lumbricidophila sp.]|nr:glycosyltransferase [Candidatus Lumbricidophila sp.]